jgi:hypothetical protein
VIFGAALPRNWWPPKRLPTTISRRKTINSNHEIILDALVEALVDRGTLDGEQVDQIISACMTARSVAAERQRRADWCERQRNAAVFLKGLA